jgi:hypothetical protein
MAERERHVECDPRLGEEGRTEGLSSWRCQASGMCSDAVMAEMYPGSPQQNQDVGN